MDVSELAGPEKVGKKKGGECCLDCFPFFSIRRTMPSRGLRPSLVRTHSRSSSGGSSKLVYNLQLTHKDPVVQSKIDKARRTSHTFEVRHHSVTISQSSSLLHNSNGACETSFMHSTIFFLFSLFGSFHGEGSLTAIWTAKSTGQCLANWEYCTCARTGASHRCTTPSYHTSTSTPGW